MRAGLCCQQCPAECPEGKQGGHPGLTKSCLVFLGWLKPLTTNCILDAELSPARGQAVAHPAPPPAPSSFSWNPAEPSQPSSSIPRGIFLSLQWPELLRGWTVNAGSRAVCPAGIQPRVCEAADEKLAPQQQFLR